MIFRPSDNITTWVLTPWIYRTLLKSFLVRDIKGRFSGSVVGIGWSVLTPLANMLIYIFIFSVVLKIRIGIEDTGTDQFVVFLLSGLLPWLAFSEAVNRSPSLLLENANLITKVSFPVAVLPYAGGLSPFLLNGIGLVLFLGFLIFLGYFHLSWIWLPVIVTLHFLFTLGLVALLSAVSVFFRDMGQIVALIVSLWFYLTPILYPVSMIPEAYRSWIMLNPAWPFIDLYRQALLLHDVSILSVCISAFIGIGVFALGGWFFMRSRSAFGDVL